LPSTMLPPRNATYSHDADAGLLLPACLVAGAFYFVGDGRRTAAAGRREKLSLTRAATSPADTTRTVPALRLDEEWARQVIEAELGVPVVQHDEGSMPWMHDLNAMYTEGRCAAIGVAAAADAEATEL
jgi:hypothetical protein